MQIINEKRISERDAALLLKETIPHLDDMPLEMLEYYLSDTGLIFYERKAVVKPLLFRLSIIPALVLWLVLFVLLPFNFIVTGVWGYEIAWIREWFRALNLHF
jgi:hypothetical protein